MATDLNIAAGLDVLFGLMRKNNGELAPISRSLRDLLLWPSVNWRFSVFTEAAMKPTESTMSAPESRLQTDELLYLSFRAAWLTTFDRLKAEYSISDAFSATGFLDRLPLAAGCAPQVQLDLLLSTWARLQAGTALTDVDKCVCYCVTDELAIVGETENERLMAQVTAGPRKVAAVNLRWLASRLRTLQITWPFETDCAELVRDVNRLSPQLDTPSRTELAETVDSLLECVGHWLVTPSIIANSNGLLLLDEQEALGCFFQEHPGLMNL